MKFIYEQKLNDKKRTKTEGWHDSNNYKMIPKTKMT